MIYLKQKILFQRHMRLDSKIILIMVFYIEKKDIGSAALFIGQYLASYSLTLIIFYYSCLTFIFSFLFFSLF